MSIPSPCINICRMDASGDHCIGCFRSLPEIAGWARADEATRQAILARARARRQAPTHPARPTMSEDQDTLYPCVGICMADPDSGYCLGCGRPPLESPDVVAEVVPLPAQPVAGTDDSA